jgi:hypothetical protein
MSYDFVVVQVMDECFRCRQLDFKKRGFRFAMQRSESTPGVSICRNFPLASQLTVLVLIE